MAPVRSTDGAGKPLGTLVNELTGLVVAYVKQETVEPVKALGRFVAFGVAGALLLAVGGGALMLGVVRLVQTETGPHLHGDLTWTPYLAGVLVAGIGAGWAISRVGRGGRHR